MRRAPRSAPGQVRFLAALNDASRDIPGSVRIGAITGIAMGLLFLCASVIAFAFPRKQFGLHLALSSAHLFFVSLAFIGTMILVAARRLPAYVLLLLMLYVTAPIAVIALASKSRTIVLEYTAIPT